MATMSAAQPSTLSFHTRLVSSSSSHTFRARLATLTLTRPENGAKIVLPTPNLWTHTSRGVVSHLTRDHVSKTRAIRGIHIPFETYLEFNPPVPTLQPGPYPLHTFHGFPPKDHILSLGLRDPNDPQVLNANGNDYIMTQSVRGAKQVTPAAFRSYSAALHPDILFSLPDIPYTPAPYSQKRLAKSIERTHRWLTDLIIEQRSRKDEPSPFIFAHLLGSSILPAREAFSDGLLEPLEGKTAELLPDLENLDQVVSGYVLDLVPIRLSLFPSSNSTTSSLLPSASSTTLVPLLNASLERLPESKPRLATGVSSPHEILQLILQCGIDVFDSAWAQRAADWGIALDFSFPARRYASDPKSSPRTAAHNLYDERYSTDFSRFSDDLGSGYDASNESTPDPFRKPTIKADGSELICPCAACSPEFSDSPIVHSSRMPDVSSPSDSTSSDGNTNYYAPPFTRAYVHHLLHTHEMSAHALLVSHNLSVLDAFFSGIRDVLSSSFSESSQDSRVDEVLRFEEEVLHFNEVYEDNFYEVMKEGKVRWAEVELARGKGRMKREKAAAAESVPPASLELEMAN